MDTTTTDRVTVAIHRVEGEADLLRQYDNCESLQPAYLELNLRTGALSCSYSAEIDGGCTFDHRNGVILSIGIPILTATTANQVMEDVRDLAQTVLDGATLYYDRQEHNLHGSLKQAARAAWDEIAAQCAPENFEDAQCVEPADAADWFAETPAAELGITADTTDVDLARIAEESTEEAVTAGHAGYNVLRGALEYLTEMRQELRDEVTDRLVESGDRYAELDAQAKAEQARRDELVRQVRGWGDQERYSLRTLGALAGVSHTEVGRIFDGR